MTDPNPGSGGVAPVPHAERRLVARHEVVGIPSRWTLPAASLLRRSRTLDVTIVDLSLTGALVRSRSDRRLHRGARVVLHIEGQPVQVVVRVVHPTDDDGSASYGVELVSVDPAVREHLDALIASRRGDAGER